MTNGHIEIYDPFAHPDGRSAGTYPDPKSTSDVANMEGTVEFRVLMAYASRRRPKTQRSPAAESGGDDADGDVKTPLKTPTQTENKVTENKNRKKKKGRRLKRMLSIFNCTRPQTKDEEDEEKQQQQKPREPGDEVAFRSFHATDEPEKKDEEEDEKAREVASRLMELADEIQLIPPEIEPDCPDDVEVEKIIGLLLRETGDKYDGKVLKDASITAELFWNYDFFRRLINTFLTQVGLRSPSPNSPGPQASPKTQMAVVCEVTTRLSAVETLPTNRLLNHGAQYMQDYFSSWVKEQGGYDAAFDETEEVD